MQLILLIAPKRYLSVSESADRFKYLADIFICVHSLHTKKYMQVNRMVKPKMMPTQIRLPEQVFKSLHTLRAAGYLPSAVMRVAIEKAVQEKIAEIEARK